MAKQEMRFWEDGQNPDGPSILVANALAASVNILIYSDLSGEIHNVQVNSENSDIGSLNHWIGRNIRDFLNEDSVPKVDHHLSALRDGDPGEQRTSELNHKDNNKDWKSPVRYTILRDADSDLVLFAGRDMTAIAAVQQELVNTQLALEADYESSRDYKTRYRAILEVAGDPLALVNINTGSIEDINSSAAEMIGDSVDALRGSDFLSRFETKDGPKNLEAIVSGSTGKPASEWQTTAKHSRKRLSVFTVPIRSAGTRYALCRLSAEKTNTDLGDFLTDGLRMLFEDGVDAIVFTNPNGIILNCNNSFLDLCDAASASDVVNRPLADFMSRGTIDQKMLIEGGSKNGQLRSYNTKVVTNYKSTLPVNVSATKLSNSKGGGFGFVIRIMRSVEAVSVSDPPSVLNANQNIAKLVGATPLKEIVAGTADVIERICIETAIDMTGNNRVAAAEMLGLSRQSLYVKLRKFDMLEKPAEG